MKKLFAMLHPYDARLIFREPGCQPQFITVKNCVCIITYPVTKIDIPAAIIQLKIYRQVPVTKNEIVIMILLQHVPAIGDQPFFLFSEKNFFVLACSFAASAT